MARVRAVPEREAGLLGRFAYRFSRRRFGEVIEPLTVTAHHPRLLFGYGMMELVLDRSSLVDESLKQIVVLKAAAMVGCEFCIDIGSTVARYSGVTEEQLRDLSNYRESEEFSPLEKLVLDYTAEMTRTPAVISQERFDALFKHFDEAQLVELTTAIALENYRARFNHAFGIGSQGFSESAYCPSPEVAARP